MITYIYFVKCPDCEDEHFDFFDDAKGYAMGCLSQRPVITQTEVNRNDFGECIDHCDLGTVWSWEDVVGKETEAEPAVAVFTKDDLKLMADGQDPEFDNLDNSVDFEVEEPTEVVPVEEPETSEVSPVERKPIPEGMTIEELVEEMEENEDTVECTWCEELFGKDQCRYEVDLGWLCGRCEAAIKSRGETLTFRENNYWDFLDEDTEKPADEDTQPIAEAATPDNEVELYYDKLTAVVEDDWSDRKYSDSYSYYVKKTDVADYIWDWLTEEDAIDVPGGLEALQDDDDLWQKFLDEHFDDLIEKYNDRLLDVYREQAEKAFTEEVSDNFDDYFGPDPDTYYDDWRELNKD